jgi:hypothetical protein
MSTSVKQLMMTCERLSVQAAEAWKKATEEERAPHVAAAEQEKEVYEKLSAEYTTKKDVDAAAAEAEALARQPLTSEVNSNATCAVYHVRPLHCHDSCSPAKGDHPSVLQNRHTCLMSKLKLQ